MSRIERNAPLPPRFLEVDGQRLEHVWLGEPRRPGPVLVFLHEGLGSVSQWKDFPERLCQAAGLSGMVYSRAGYGRSSPATLPRPVTFMHAEARLLPFVLEAAGIEDAILVGHSDGASIALIHAGTSGARVRGLVLEAPHVFVEDICIEAITALRAAYATSELREKLARHHTDVDATFHGWVDVWLHPDFRSWNIEPCLPGVRVPTLVIQGEGDGYGTLLQVDAVCQGLGAPCERRILPRSVGHSPHRDAPDDVITEVTTFIEKFT
jgi:pimeloyl-ACP methyl ester carboxylesterase